MKTFREFTKSKKLGVMVTEGDNDLIEASRLGDITKVKEIIKSKQFNINDTEEYGYTAIMSASYNAHVEVVRLLVKIKGIDLDKQVKSTANRKTALHYAFECEDTPGAKISKLLLDAGANPHIGEKDGITQVDYVLSYALEYDKKKIFGVYKRAGVFPEDKTPQLLEDTISTLKRMSDGYLLKDPKYQAPGSYDDIYVEFKVKYAIERKIASVLEDIEKIKYKSKLT